MDAIGMSLHVQAPVNTMASSKSQEQTVLIKLSDYKKIEKKITSYQTRLKGFENLQNLLTKRDEDLTYYKQQARKFETLYNEQLQNNMAANGNHQQNGHFDSQVVPQQHIFQQQQHSPQNVAPSTQVAQSPQYIAHSPQQVAASPQVSHSPQYVAHSPQQVTNSPQQHQSPCYHQADRQQQHERAILRQLQLQQHQQAQQQQQQLQQQQLNMIQSYCKQPGMLNDGLSTINFPEYMTCRSEADREYSASADMSSLELILGVSATDMVVPNGLPTCLNPTSPGRFYTDAMVDGEEEPSMSSLQKIKPSSTSVTSNSDKAGDVVPQSASTQPAPIQPSVSNTVFLDLVQNNRDLQQRLREAASLKGTSRTKLEYEQVITSLRIQLIKAEDHHKNVVEVKSLIQHGAHNKVGEILADYKDKIANLKQIVFLKQSLIKRFTKDGYKAGEQKGCRDVKNEETQTSTRNIDSIIDGLLHTSLNDENCKTKLEVDPEVEAEVARLADEIAAHKDELASLEKHLGKLKQEVRVREDALATTDQKVENQTVRLQQTEVEVDKNQALCDQLRQECHAQEAKLNNLNQDISKKGAQTDTRVAEMMLDAVKKENTLRRQQFNTGLCPPSCHVGVTWHLAQGFLGPISMLMSFHNMQNMQYRYEKEMTTVMSQSKRMFEENDKLQQQLDQLKQHYEYQLKMPRRPQVPVVPIIPDLQWNSRRPLPTAVIQDGPQSSLPGSLAPSSIGSADGLPSASSRESSSAGSVDSGYGNMKEVQHDLKCRRCLRQFPNDQAEYYRDHLKKCIDG